MVRSIFSVVNGDKIPWASKDLRRVLFSCKQNELLQRGFHSLPTLLILDSDLASTAFFIAITNLWVTFVCSFHAILSCQRPLQTFRYYVDLANHLWQTISSDWKHYWEERITTWHGDCKPFCPILIGTFCLALQGQHSTKPT